MGIFNKTSSVIFGLALSAQGAWASATPNRLIVKWRMPTTMMNVPVHSEEVEAALRSLGFVSKVAALTEQTFVVRYSTEMSPVAAAQALERSPGIAWAQPDYVLGLFPDPTPQLKAVRGAFDQHHIFENSFLPLQDPRPIDAPELPGTPSSDPRLSEAWGMGRIEAPAAWRTQRGSRNIIVADIDTGIDYQHEDLVNNLWEGIGYDFVSNDNLPYDDNAHGTHTAGTIGATGGNGVGVSGVSPQVSIMALKFIAKEGFGTTADAVRAIDFAIKNGARVMSNSWGGRTEEGEEGAAENRALEEAVERARQADILFVAAAGNDGTNNDVDPVYPAAIEKDNVITVASISSKDKISFFSNYGQRTVHVAAPGGGVLSTVPGNDYRTFNGTSMACPHVAGLAALLLAERPEMTAVQVKQIIMDTVDLLPSLNGKTVTGGRINARAALERVRQLAL